MGDSELDAWFVREILPLEPILVRFLHRNWTEEAEVADLRQEAYVRVYEAAAKERPVYAKAFLFQTVRNLVIDRLRQKNVVSIETIPDFESLNVSSDDPSAERYVLARQQIRLLRDALEQLPPRCREVVVLRKIEGLSQREVAKRLNITEDTVEHQVAKGIRALARAVYSQRAPIVANARLYSARTKAKTQ
jgi:RNA polymerase sigma factor (sigma-70 family)